MFNVMKYVVLGLLVVIIGSIDNDDIVLCFQNDVVKCFDILLSGMRGLINIKLWVFEMGGIVEIMMLLEEWLEFVIKIILFVELILQMV